MHPSRKSTLVTSVALLALLASNGLAQEEPSATELGLDLIDRMPSPSHLAVAGRLLKNEGTYHLTVEYRTATKKRHKALLLYAEPSHRLLFVQWTHAPAPEIRSRVNAEGPLATRVGDYERRSLKIPFDPGEDDSVRAVVLTWDDRRLEVLRGKVEDLRSFAVESVVFD